MTRAGNRRELVLLTAALLALGVVVAFALAAPRAADPQWRRAQTLAPAAKPASLRLQSGSSGEGVAVWLAREPGGVAPYASMRAPGGHFQAAQRLAAAGRVSDLALAVDRVGDAVAVWRRRAPGGARVEAARRQAGQPFAPPLVVAGGSDPVVAVALDAGGRAEIMWATPPARSGQRDARLLLCNWPAGGAPEAPREVLRAGPHVLQVGSLAAGERETLVVVRVGGRVQSLFAAAGGPAAKTQTLSGPDASRPAVAADRRGDAVIAWQRAGTVEFALRPAERDVGGRVRAGPGGPPVAAIDEEGLVTIAFHDPRGTTIATANATSPGDGSPRPQTVVRGAAAAIGVDADVQGTTQLLVGRPDGSLVAVSKPWLRGWQAPKVLARSGAVGAQIAAGAAGTALVAWPAPQEIRVAIRALPGPAAYSPLVTR